MSDIPKKYRGTQFGRTSHSSRELQLARAWARMNASAFHKSSFLAHLMTFETRNASVEDVSERDHIVAATVIQWLGSPVGQQFLKDHATLKGE